MSDEEKKLEEQRGIAIKERLKKPSLYKCVLLNDDYTPMDFVIQVLRTYFQKDEKSAYDIMMQVHTQGKGVAGVYPHDIAETKAFVVNAFAKQNQHPLKCAIEKD